MLQGGKLRHGPHDEREPAFLRFLDVPESLLSDIGARCVKIQEKRTIKYSLKNKGF
jgi:hypothetical protein